MVGGVTRTGAGSDAKLRDELARFPRLGTHTRLETADADRMDEGRGESEGVIGS